VVPRASHYGMRIVDGKETGERTTEGLDIITQWLRDRFQP